MATWKKPADWHDVERMNFLSAPLPEKREDKPSQWDTQVEFWSGLILSSSSECCTLSASGKDLDDRFLDAGRKASCLGGVVKESCKQRSLRTLRLWQNDCRDSWLQWGAGLASAWINDSMEAGDAWLEEIFVFPALIKQFGSSILGEHSRRTRSTARNGLLSSEGFLALCRDVYPDLSDRDVQLVRSWLRKACKLAAQRDEDGSEMIKLTGQAEKGVAPVTKQDIALYKLHQCSTMLTTQIDKVSAEVTRCTEKAKEKQMLGLRDAALTFLRRRKRLLKTLSQKEGIHDNVEHLMDNLVAANDDKKIVSALEQGTSVYRDVMAGLDVDKLADTMDDLRDLHDKHSEITTELSGSLAGDQEEIDLTELEAELDSLILDERSDRSGAAPRPAVSSPVAEVCVPVTPPVSSQKAPRQTPVSPALPTSPYSTPQRPSKQAVPSSY